MGLEIKNGIKNGMYELRETLRISSTRPLQLKSRLEMAVLG